jgi:hypothetical protein
MWIKSVQCIHRYRTSFRSTWISRKTNSCTHDNATANISWTVASKTARHLVPCTASLLTRLSPVPVLSKIHCTYLTITKPTASQKLCLIYKNFAVLSTPLYCCHSCKTMNSQHVRMLGVQNKARMMITFVLFSPCVVSDRKILVETNAHITLIYWTLSGFYMFRPFAIPSEHTTSTKNRQTRTQQHTKAHAVCRYTSEQRDITHRDRTLFGS